MAKAVTLSKDKLLQFEVILPALAFSIPLLVSGPQLLTGTVVNTLLILSTTKLAENKWTTIAVLPSIAALLNGVLFAKFTPFLLFFLPCIWVGNYAFMKAYTEIRRRSSFPVGLLFSAGLKTLILYLSVLFYFQLHLVPEVFITIMSVFQFVTAIAGGILAYVLLRVTTR